MIQKIWMRINFNMASAPKFFMILSSKAWTYLFKISQSQKICDTMNTESLDTVTLVIYSYIALSPQNCNNLNSYSESLKYFYTIECLREKNPTISGMNTKLRLAIKKYLHSNYDLIMTKSGIIHFRITSYLYWWLFFSNIILKNIDTG